MNTNASTAVLASIQSANGTITIISHRNCKQANSSLSGDFYLGPIRCRPDLGGGADQHGNDEIRFGDPDCAKQGVGIDLVNHSTPDGLQGHRPPDELLVMVTAFARSR